MRSEAPTIQDVARVAGVGRPAAALPAVHHLLRALEIGRIYFSSPALATNHQLSKSTIEKIEKFGKSFDQLTIETVKAFYKDAKSANFKI